MARSAKSAIVSDKDVMAMLERYRCPVPFNIKRTRFLDNIVTPGQQVSPINMLKALWVEELSPFESLEGLNEVLDTLIMDLWN